MAADDGVSGKPRIFVSYAHRDTKWLNLLETHLKGLRNHAQVAFYTDRHTPGGGDWDAEIKDNLEKADIFLPIVTPAFAASDYIHEVELPIAKRRREAGACVIMPVYAEQCRFSLLGLSNVNFMPKDDQGQLTPLEEWEDRFLNRALTKIVEDIEKQITALASRTALVGEIDLGVYRQRAMAKWQAIDLSSLAAPGADADVRIRLTDVFVLPNARRSRPPLALSRDYLKEQGLDPDKEDAAAAERAQLWDRATPEPALALIARADRRLTLMLGDPGAGKSSLTRYVLLRLLDGVPDDASALAGLRGHLPLLIELRDFVLEESNGHCTDLLDYLDYCGRTLGFGFTRAKIEAHLATQPALLIIDGLDEIFDPNRRKQMAEQIVGLTVRYPALRVLVTSRIAGFDEHPFRSAEFEIATLTDLTPEQIDKFADDWFRLVFPGDAATAERTRDDLRQTLARRAQLKVLAGNPMMLTIMATIARYDPLGRSRAGLYAQALALLCYNWDYRRGLKLPPDSPLRDLTPNDTLLMLRRVAWRMQEAPAGLRGNAISQNELRGVIETFVREDWGFPTPKARRATEEMMQRLQERNWMLTLRGPGLFGFVHRTFLEYLCALEISERFKAQILDAGELIDRFVTPRLTDDAWHEVLRLLAGLLPATVAEQMVVAIVPDDDAVVKDAARLALAWQVLAEVKPALIPGLREACGRLTDSLYVWLARGQDDEWKATAAIAEAAESIGGIGWPVPHPPNRPWPARSYRLIGAHPFLIGALGTSIWNCAGAARGFLERGVAGNADAILALAAHFRDQPGIPDLIRERAVNDTDGDTRGAAIEALAAHFRDHPETADLIRERAVNDTYGYPRGAAIEALAAYFRDQPGTADLIRERAVNDTDGYTRCAAVLALARSSGVPNAAVLCSRNLVGYYPGLDPREPVSAAHVRKAAAKLGQTEAEVRGLFERIAADIPLTLSWIAKAGAAPKRRGRKAR